MEDKDLKNKQSTEYEFTGLENPNNDWLQEIQDKMSTRFEGLSQEEFEVELNKQLEEMLEDAKNDPIKPIEVKKPKK